MVESFGHDYRSPGLATVALPASVKRSFSSASRALARSIDSSVVSIQPAPMSSPVRTLPETNSSSSCSETRLLLLAPSDEPTRC